MKTRVIVNGLTQSATRWLDSKWSVAVIIALGVFFRVVPYVLNRSLWIDEAYVSMNILNRSWAGLVQPLDYDEVAPLGFLFAQKGIVSLFGNNEYSLRLLPLLAGIGALLLFYTLARRCLSRNTALLALTLFALLNSHIYYSSEAKQYSTDVLITILLLLSAHNLLQSSQRNWLAPAWLGIGGAIAVWFSHPSVFVLAGIGVTLGIYYWAKCNYRSLVALICAGALWVVSFAALYTVSLRHLAENASLDSQWQFALAPLPFHPITMLRWLATVLMGIFTEPLNLQLPGLALFCLVVGTAALLMQRQWSLALWLTPLGFTLIAAIFQQYPFSGRLLLFLIPMLLLILAHGAIQVYASTRDQGIFVGILLVSLIVFSSLGKAVVHLEIPRAREEIKPVLAYLRDHFQESDTLYVYYWGQFTLKYYQEAYGIHDYVLGVRWNENSWNLGADDLNKLRGRKRVWVLFTQGFRGNDEEPEEKFLRFNLDRLGTLVSLNRATGASIYLYDLSK